MLRFVVMAAGRASRMGQDKLAMPWGDTTILGHVLRTLKEAIFSYLKSNHQNNHQNNLDKSDASSCKHLYEILVVAPKACSDYGLDEKWYNPLQGNCRWICSYAGQPLAETIRRGLEDRTDDLKGVCFIPGDQVGMDPHTLTEMIRFFIAKEPDFLIPKESERTGSPVFFHSRYISDLLNLQGEQGGRHVLKSYRDRWVTYPVKEGFFLDIDTMAEYLDHRSLPHKNNTR